MAMFSWQEFGNTISQFPDHQVLSVGKLLQGDRGSMIWGSLFKRVRGSSLVLSVGVKYDCKIVLVCLSNSLSSFPLPLSPLKKSKK